MAKIYVLFHRACMDGAGAKFAAYLKFGSSAEYIDVQYREPVPELENGSDVYILDFSYSREILEDLNRRMNKLVVLDHHKTAQEDLKGLPYATFDMNKSGAMMAWEYFHPGKTIPEMIYLVQDRDLWKFSFRDRTRRVHAGFQLHRENLSSWGRACSISDEGRYFLDTIEKEGKAILEYDAVLIKAAMAKLKVVPFLHTRVGIVNSSVLKDELGEHINATQNVTGAIIYTIEPITMKALLSFRGPKDTDWSWVARALGGGGHATSCNAAVDLETLLQILDGRFRQLPRTTWIGTVREWFNRKMRYFEEAMH